MQRDFYQILNIGQEASPEEIKEQYLKLALLHHPDKGGDREKFKDINLAYKILSDAKKRKKYDTSLASTIDELRQTENRDTDYHQSDKFVKAGTEEFDQEKFNEEFKNTLDEKKLAELEKMKADYREHTYESLLAERELVFEKDSILTPGQEFDLNRFNQMFL